MNGIKLLSPQQAEEAISSRLTCLPIESLPLMQCVGATLREDVVAERDLPPFDRVCMDGIAVDSGALGHGLRRFMVQATQAAGSPALQLERTDNAIEVMTGAILPRAADCIVPVEQYSIEDGIISLTSAAVSTPSSRDNHSCPRAPPERSGCPRLPAQRRSTHCLSPEGHKNGGKCYPMAFRSEHRDLCWDSKLWCSTRP